MKLLPVTTAIAAPRDDGTEGGGQWRLRVGGATVRVAARGQGPPLLLPHGIGGNIEMWQPVLDRTPGRCPALLFAGSRLRTVGGNVPDGVTSRIG